MKRRFETRPDCNSAKRHAAVEHERNCQLDETVRISIDCKFEMLWGGSTANKRGDEEAVLLNLEIRPRRMQIPEVIIVQVLVSHENRNPCIVITSRCSPRTRPNLVHLHIEHRPSPLVAADTSERQGPAATVLSYSDDTAICKVSRERASTLGAADSLFGTTVVLGPSILVSKLLLK